jgi:LPXTG-motif cell wall-anchored protein
MRNLLLGSLLVLAATALPALAQTVPYRAVPGPLMGAGLPVLLIGGVYWFVRRRRNSGSV